MAHRSHRKTASAHNGGGHRTPPQPESKSGIFAVLRRDHQRIDELMSELEETSDEAIKTREELFRRLRDQLDFHSRSEESVFYARLRETSERGRILSSIEEHHLVTMLLGELDAMPKDHERWHPKLQLLRQNVQLHIEKEENEIFAEARELIDRHEEERLGAEMTRMEEAWLELGRRSPAAAGVVRGLTQIAERLPYGAGAVATMVQASPSAVGRLSAAVDVIAPPRSMGLLRRVSHIALIPISLPLALVTGR